MSEKFDVVYLGSGHGTFDGAIPLAARGKKVAVIEADLIGGTCPNQGCNAKITLDQPVALKNQVANFQGYGLRGEPTIDWQANFDHERDVIAGLPDMIAGLMTSAGVTSSMAAERSSTTIRFRWRTRRTPPIRLSSQQVSIHIV